MTNDDKILASSGNVFADLGFPEPQATVHLMRAKLMVQIEKMIDEEKLTQVQAAKKLHVSQARISDLKRGKVEKFSLDTLIEFTLRMGKSVERTLQEIAK
jgi:predicted XRE-type DNA-binding protein